MTELILTVLGLLGGVVGTVLYNARKKGPPRVPESRPNIQLTDEEQDEIRRKLAAEQDLVEQVRKGGDPDAILTDLDARNDNLNDRLDKLS